MSWAASITQSCSTPTDAGKPFRRDTLREADAILRAAAVIAGDLGRRHAARRDRSNHGSHDEAVRQVERVQAVVPEQDGQISGTG